METAATKTSFTPDNDDNQQNRDDYFRLVEVCSEPLTTRFSLGRLDDLRLVVDTQTGYFNATGLCKTFGRHLKNWQRKTDTKKFLRVLEEGGSVRKPLFRWTASAVAGSGDGGISSSGSGSSSKTDARRTKIRGTYAHPHLLLHLLDYASPTWSIRMNGIVGRHYAKEFADGRERNEMEDAVELPTTKGSDGKPTPPGKRASRKQHLLVVVSKNAPGDGSKYPFYVIRCHRRSKTTQLKKLRRKYPDLAEELQVSYDATATNLLERMKEKGRNFSTVYNELVLFDGYTIKQFETDARKIAADEDGPG